MRDIINIPFPMEQHMHSSLKFFPGYSGSKNVDVPLIHSLDVHNGSLFGDMIPQTDPLAIK